MHRSSLLRMRYCACAVNFVAFVMGKRYFSPIRVSWLNVRRSALKVTK